MDPLDFDSKNDPEKPDKSTTEFPIEQPTSHGDVLVLKVDGKEYIAVSTLAQETGYEADHIGRLARQGKVESVKSEKRWYVSRISLEEYRKSAAENKRVSAAESIRVLRKSKADFLRRPIVPSIAPFQIVEHTRASRVSLGSSFSGGLKLTLLALFIFSLFSTAAFTEPKEVRDQQGNILTTIWNGFIDFITPDPILDTDIYTRLNNLENGLNAVRLEVDQGRITYQVIERIITTSSLPIPTSIATRLTNLEILEQENAQALATIDQRLNTLSPTYIFSSGPSSNDSFDEVTTETLTVSGNSTLSSLGASSATIQNLTVEGTASISQYFGGELADCDGPTQTLNWDETTGHFSCGTDSGAGTSEIKTEEGGTTVLATTTTLNFNAGHFSLTASGSSETIVGLDWGSAGPASLSQDETVTGFWIFSNRVSISSNLEVSGYASASSFKGSAFSSVGDCNDDTDTLGWDNGTFSCGTDATGGGGGSGTLQIRELANFDEPTAATISFEPGQFALTSSGSSDDVIVKLDWTNGPASRSANQTITGFWVFSAGASFSTNLEVEGTTSISGQFTLNGNASSSKNFEISGYASASKYFGASLAQCNTAGSSALTWNAGLFGCNTISGGGGGGAMQVRELGAFDDTSVATISFEPGHFAVTSSGTADVVVRLDWGAAGPASLSQNETVTGAWEFTGFASFSGGASVSPKFEVYNPTGTASFEIYSGTSSQQRFTIRSVYQGIGNSASESLQIINGANRTIFTVASNGFVGINKSNPNSYLYISADTGKSAVISLQSSSNAAGSYITYLGNDVSANVTQWSTGINIGLTGRSFEIYDNVKSLDRLVINSSGNVGIGTTVPSGKFNIIDTNPGTTSSSSFELTSSNTLGSVASISATALTTGNAFKILVPTTSTFSGNIFQAKDTNGLTLASISAGGNAEFLGYASASRYYGGSLSSCNSASNALTWNAGVFGCNTITGGGGNFGGIEIAESDGSFSIHYGSISFDSNMFRVGAGTTASQAFVRLDWTNGPASRSATQDITGLWNFSAASTQIALLELSGAASIGGNVVTRGTLSTTGDVTFSSNASVSGIFEIGTSKFYVDSGNSRVGINTQSLTEALEVAGTASVSGFALFNSSASVSGNFEIGNNALVIRSGGVSTSLAFETTSYASGSKYFGAGLSSCSGPTNALTWVAGTFGCNLISASGGASPITVKTSPAGTRLSGIVSLSFDNTSFDIAASGSGDVRISLDYINGPASRTMDQIISGLWTFSGGVSISSPLELTSGASISAGTNGFNINLNDTGTFKIKNSAGTDILLVRNGTTPGSVSVSANFEVSNGYASAAAYFGGGLTNCSDSNDTLQWTSSTGQFNCRNDGVGVNVTWGNVNIAANRAAPATYAPSNTGFELGLYRSSGTVSAFLITSSSLDRYRMNSSGYLSGCLVNGNLQAASGITAGRFELVIYKNDVLVTSSYCTMDNGTASRSAQSSIDPTVATFVSGDRFVVMASTNAAYAPATLDIFATLTFVLDGADLAEYYYTNDAQLYTGMIAQTDESLFAGAKRAEDEGKILGVISDGAGLTLGSKEGPARPLLVALSGRVPVLVKGSAKAGDYITLSDEPGIGKKAEKAGYVIGQLIEDKDYDEVGSVFMLIKNSYYTGSAIVDSENNVLNVGTQILTALVSNQAASPSTSFNSQINTDRVIAGLDIITPKIITGDIITNTLTAQIISATGTGSLTFQGDSFFDNIFANEINSPVITELKDSLETQASISQSLATRLTNLENGLTIENTTLMAGKLVVDEIGSSENALSILSDTIFFGRPIFNSDMGGFAVIHEGRQRVDITFDKEYLELPIINVTLRASSTSISAEELLSQGINYIVEQNDRNGFSILLENPAQQDISFGWTAIAIKNPRTFFSEIAQPIPTVVEVSPSPEPESSDVPEITPSPSPDSTSSPETEDTPDETSPTPEITPEVTPEHALEITPEPTPDITPAPQPSPEASADTAEPTETLTQ